MYTVIIHLNIIGSNRIGYCRFENFHKNLIFANSVKRHICHVKTLQLGHDLPTLNDKREMSILRGKFRENKTLVKIYEFTVVQKK